MSMFCPVCKTTTPGPAVYCLTCGAELHNSEPGSVETTNATERGTTLALAIGSVLQGGQYTLSAVLGRGGFGITYRGHDASLNRSVAIKEFFPLGCQRRNRDVQTGPGVLSAKYDEARSRFVAEAYTLARFQHAGIVDVYAVFEENNTAYMVMEFLQGQTLQQLIEARGALSMEEAVELVTKAGEALSVVHQAGLLHRDIKPENIVLCDGRRVVLIDFGTARELLPDLTQQMTTAVTPGYAPIEQYGQQSRFGASTDIYALGATLYHMLTGQPPVEAPDRVAGVPLEAPAQLTPTVSHAVSETTMWALQNKAEDRPQSMPEFLYSLANGTDAATSRAAVAAAASTAAAPVIIEQAETTVVSPHEPDSSARRREFDDEEKSHSRRTPAQRWAFAVIPATLGILGWMFWPRPQSPPPSPPIAVPPVQPTAVPPHRSLIHKTPEEERKLKSDYDNFIKTLDNDGFAKRYPNEYMITHNVDSAPMGQAVFAKRLSDTGQVEAIPYVTWFLDAPKPLVRCASGYYLARLVSEQVSSQHGGGTARTAKTRLRPLAWVVLQMLKQPPYNEYYSYAAEIIGDLGLRDFEPELRELLRSEDAAVANAARDALQQLGLKVESKLELQRQREKAAVATGAPISSATPVKRRTVRPALQISKTPAQQARMKQAFESFIKAIDMDKIIATEPRIARDLKSLNPYVQSSGVEDVLHKTHRIDKVDKIRLLAPFVESSESESGLKFHAVTGIEELATDILMKRRDTSVTTRVVIKPRTLQDPDLSPLAWTVLQLLKSWNANRHDYASTDLYHAAKLIGILQLKEFEPELKQMVESPGLDAEHNAREALELLSLNVPQQ